MLKARRITHVAVHATWLYFLCIATALASVVSFSKWSDILGKATETNVPEIKKTLLSSGNLWNLHNQVYEKIGAANWKKYVKPLFLEQITLATIRDTGNFLPSADDIIQWAQQHSVDAEKIMKWSGEEFQKANPPPRNAQ